MDHDQVIMDHDQHVLMYELLPLVPVLCLYIEMVSKSVRCKLMSLDTLFLSSSVPRGKIYVYSE